MREAFLWCLWIRSLFGAMKAVLSAMESSPVFVSSSSLVNAAGSADARCLHSNAEWSIFPNRLLG